MTGRSNFWPRRFLAERVLVLCASLVGLATSDCIKINSCSCQDSGGAGTIDLSPLDSGSGQRFKDQSSMADSYLYSWNPCSSFSETSACTSVSGCQLMAGLKTGYPIGTQDSATFTTDPLTGNLNINYRATDISGGLRYLSINLVCDRTADPGTLSVFGEATTSHYGMTLTSVHCCPTKGPGPHGTVSVSLSAGTVLTIVFFATLFVYLTVGLMVQKFARKASGRELFPNINFWAALPGRIKDGFVFAFTCGRRGSYNKI